MTKQALIRQNRYIMKQLDETKRLLRESNKEILALEQELIKAEMQKESYELWLENKRLRRGNDQQRKTIIKCRNIMAQLRNKVAVIEYLSDEPTVKRLIDKVQRILDNPKLTKHQKSMEIKAMLDKTKKLRLYEP